MQCVNGFDHDNDANEADWSIYNSFTVENLIK